MSLFRTRGVVTRAAGAMLRAAGGSKSWLSNTSETDVPLALYDAVSDGLVASAETFHDGLRRDGMGVVVLPEFVDADAAGALRAESEDLWKKGRFEPSYSEVIDGESGEATRHYKPGVHSLELAGDELEEAPLLLHYTAAVMQTLPQVCDHFFGDAEGIRISTAEYGTKLAIAVGGGSKYPRHVDNVGPPSDDLRKLTVILYLNPGWDSAFAAEHGGELRLWGRDGVVEDVAPDGGTLVAFWADQVVHEVLPSTADEADQRHWRHALTLWLVADSPAAIADPTHPLASTRESHFPR